jgi:hypothetical protein
MARVPPETVTLPVAVLAALRERRPAPVLRR